MLKKIKDAIDAGRNAVAEASAEVASQSVNALLVLDELGALADETRRRHIAQANKAGHRILLILGPNSELEHHDISLHCEFIPRARDIAVATGHRPDSIQRYRVARLRLILAKWGVTECRWVGDSASELVDHWSAPSNQQVTFLAAH